MSNSAHTPGPYWFAQAEDSARFDYAVGAGDSEIAHVAEESDARLFKAAPAMLAALESIIAGGSWHDDGSFVYVPPGEGEGAIGDAVKAVAAAKGQAS